MPQLGLLPREGRQPRLEATSGDTTCNHKCVTWPHIMDGARDLELESDWNPDPSAYGHE